MHIMKFNSLLVGTQLLMRYDLFRLCANLTVTYTILPNGWLFLEQYEYSYYEIIQLMNLLCSQNTKPDKTTAVIIYLYMPISGDIVGTLFVVALFS